MADSKRLLADALTGLMECKPLDQVRVAEIASAAGMSKQTFYHHFSDKYHLMEHCFRDMFAAPFERMGTLAPFDECYIEFLQLCHQRKTFLRNAFTSQDVNSLYRVMHRALRDVFGARVRVHGVLDEGETGVLPGLLLERLRRLHASLVRPGHGFRGCRAGRPYPPVHPRRGRKVFRVAGSSCASRRRRCLPPLKGDGGQRRVHVGILGARRIAVSTPPSPCLRFRVRIAGRKAWLFRAICCVRGQKCERCAMAGWCV